RNTVGLSICMLTAGFCLGLCGCKDPVSYGNIPERSVNFTVRPYDMDNILMAVGGVKEFPYGYNGVCVYHIGDMAEEYVAFEQACPLDWESGCYVQYDKAKDRFVGKDCGGEFSSYSGFGYNKVSRFALRKYRITYLNNGTFQVSN
ncbi:MAG: hypothetical protein K2M74_04100, partial [Bacteroidales bacterium]|nr:hypothetical protein [Bacteroidales bacterium]